MNHREPRRLTVSTGAWEPRPASRTPIAITVSSLLAAIAVTVVVALVGATPSQAASPQDAARVVATELPDSAAGRQLRWFLEASARPPLSEVELRAHFSKWFLSWPGQSPADINADLATATGPDGLHLIGLTLVQPNALAASVTGRDAQLLLVTVVTDDAGRIDFGVIRPAAPTAEVTLPPPTGRASVGTDIVEIVDPKRHGRRLLLTRWYPAASGARRGPPAAYTSPLRIALGIPSARVHARSNARPLRGRLPVVLFSPGASTARDLYQSLAEDLASHGYLVLAVDHTGETPVQFPDGHVEGRVVPATHPLATLASTRLADMRLILRRLNTIAPGPRGDRRRVAAIGHSLGGSTAAALMRAEPSVRAGVDMDGSIFGPARRLGVPGPFMVMVGDEGLDPSIRAMLKHSPGPVLAVKIAGFVHFSFSDLPVSAPAGIEAPTSPSARDIALQRTYLRAFLDRSMRGRRSPLLDGPSLRWPQVSFPYRPR
jgi:dienelactone hydrolase